VFAGAHGLLSRMQSASSLASACPAPLRNLAQHGSTKCSPISRTISRSSSLAGQLAPMRGWSSIRNVRAWRGKRGVSQIPTFPSDTVTTRAPSADIATTALYLVRPWILQRRAPVSASHTLTSWCGPTVTTREPSADIATLSNQYVWPRSMRRQAPVSASHHTSLASASSDRATSLTTYQLSADIVILRYCPCGASSKAVD
jgi:hypothetical protein